MRVMIAGLLAISATLPALAEPLELDYSTLYSHTRKLDKDELSALQFAFGFMHHQTKQMCHLESAYLHTQKQDIAIEITPEQRFTVPSEKALSLAKAVARFELREPVNQCDMSVQLETKPAYLKSSYDLSELKAVNEQYTEFFDSMGSFLSFMMPSVKGIVLHFPPQTEGSVRVGGMLEPSLRIENGELSLDEQWLNKSQRIEFPTKPYRITAITK
ncbi:DUF2987 domain-containing protein [Bowmanella sp. Y26]|uniref:DUF2987 domain-containing protein n=1 Tax=Bowmanella yangjiangensis TaxID=2811230 RepID=UPI001BDCE726|nr:DUF2987 domain-containing protein [Bowmanella yangjiangensis]MBT1063692.1 DUF2987 domain-containing protein [Bowmanella yangjiangensis]